MSSAGELFRQVLDLFEDLLKIVKCSLIRLLAVKIPPPVTIQPATSEWGPDSLSVLPDGPGVYALVKDMQIVHVSSSSRLRKRIARLLSPQGSLESAPTARFTSAGIVIQCWPTVSKLHSSLLTYQLLKTSAPADYLKRLRLRLPWFLALTRRDKFPRLTISNRMVPGHGLAFGPFTSRESAQDYENELLSLFPLRRCTETLEPSPDHPGCFYGEIGQCLRPCQSVVDEAQYKTAVDRAAEFLFTDGKTSVTSFATMRDQAAHDMDFERAGQLHKQIQRLKDLVRERGELISNATTLSGVALAFGPAPPHFNSFRW